MKRPRLDCRAVTGKRKTDYNCPHCGVLQAVDGLLVQMGSFNLTAFQCVNCADIEVGLLFLKENGLPAHSDIPYPLGKSRLAKSFLAAPHEVEGAYNDACVLFPVHTGASGAYARRALELLLDNAGYESKSLADSISLARAESDPDRRLSRRLLQKLDYIKEIGNFALHVRRNGELSIVEISSEEVSACLETIEDLISELFEAPVSDYKKTVELNEKLVAAGKKPIALPDLPAGLPPVQESHLPDVEADIVVSFTDD